MGYVDSTPPQVARVIGGWGLGLGIFLFVLTFRGLGNVRSTSEAIAAIFLVVIGGLLLVFGSRRLAVADRANHDFFAKSAGTEILTKRRLLQARLVSLRLRLFLALLVAAAVCVVFISTYSCTGDICSGFVSNQETWIFAFQWVCLGLGVPDLVVATLARVHGSETDRWEELASDYLRRRDDGPVPGLKRSRWE